MLTPQNEELFKSFGVGPDANGAQNLTPSITSKIITEVARLTPVFRNAIPTISWPTKVYDWRSRLTPGYAQTITDLGNISVTDGQFTDGTATMSQYVILNFLSNFAISVDQPLVDVKKLFVLGSTQALVRLENYNILNGDANQAGNPGFYASMASGYTANVIGSGATANFNLFAAMNTYQKKQGYAEGPRAWVASMGLAPLLQAAAFAKVRFIGDAQESTFSFRLEQGSITVCGVPVFFDPHASVVKTATNETLGGSGVQYSFAQKFPIAYAWDNQATQSYAAPVIKVAGTTQPASAYSISVDPTGLGIVTFNSAPGSAPTATYQYEAQYLSLVSLDANNLVRPVNQALQLDQDLANPYTQLATPIRLSQFSTLAVRNTGAHLVASNVIVPTAANF